MYNARGNASPRTALWAGCIPVRLDHLTSNLTVEVDETPLNRGDVHVCPGVFSRASEDHPDLFSLSVCCHLEVSHLLSKPHDRKNYIRPFQATLKREHMISCPTCRSIRPLYLHCFNWLLRLAIDHRRSSIELDKPHPYWLLHLSAPQFIKEMVVDVLTISYLPDIIHITGHSSHKCHLYRACRNVGSGRPALFVSALRSSSSGPTPRTHLREKH